tara:strand:- start:714 stop:1250 length:537 start_codon:yes stop_codon:yes gene_type:complete
VKKIVVEVLLLLVFATCSCAATQDPKLEDSAPRTSSTTTRVPQTTTSTSIEKPPELLRLEEAWDLAAARPGADIGQVFQLFRLKQSLGPKNMACYDEVSGDVCEQIVEAINIVGLPEEHVTLLLDSLELPHRVIERDCELLMVTQEFIAGRVNLAIAEGTVTGWASEGGRNFDQSRNC